MANAGTGWLKGCAIGCGAMVLLGILGTVGGGWALLRPLHQATAAREDLDARYPDQAGYTPPSEGAVPADRMEAFLAVRTELMPHCAGFTAAMGQFRRMDEMGEHPGAGVVVHEVLRTTKTAVGMAKMIGNFTTARDRLLLEHGMGFGEYTYIYAVAYYGWLGKVSENEHVKVDGDEASPRVRRDLRAMLRRQLESLTGAGADPALVELLRAELVRLEEDRDRFPWQDGPPPALLASLEPYHDQLAALYCPDMSPFDLSVVRRGRGGITIHSD